MSDGETPVIWLRPARGARGPRPAYDRDTIAATAIRIADAEGIDAVSLRRVAAEIGSSPTALYRYVLRKDELFELMIDAVLGQQPRPEPPGEWRAHLRLVARTIRQSSLAHPWLAALSAGRATLSPNSLQWMEYALRAFDGLDLSADEALSAIEILTAFVSGHVLRELSEAETTRLSGLNREQWMAAQGEYGDAIMAGHSWPRLVRVMREARGPHDPDRLETGFERGVECVLDGLRIS